MPRILVTNDDGVHSEGIQALATALEPLGEVIVVAPHAESSAIGHALTLRRPLRIESYRPGYYAVDGTPTDCVNLGIAVLLKNETARSRRLRHQHRVESGRRHHVFGHRGRRARRRAVGVPAIAVSLARSRDYVFDFGPSAQAAALLAELVLQHGLPDRTFLNVNVPKGIPRGFKRTVQGKRNHITKISERTDPRGKPYYWIEEGIDDWTPHDLSDYHACKERYISVSLLSPDMTAYSSMEQLAQLPMPEGFTVQVRR